MVILGIDPGTTAVGYALLEAGSTPRLRDAGLFRITKADPRDRLLELYYEIKKILGAQKPDMVAVEKLFFMRNAKTAMAVAESRGIILLTAALADLKVYEYAPREVKKALTGDGAADKTQVRKMVQLTLPEAKSLRAQDDVFDAIAIALTCSFKERINPRKSAG